MGLVTAITDTTEVPRDRWGKPRIKQPDGKRIPYARWSSYGDVLENRFNLERWKVRMAALGIADRKDLLLAVSAHCDDKRKLNDICDQAIEAAKASAAATIGTALHALTEVVDRGDPLPTLPDDARADLHAYEAAMRPLKVVGTEQFVVCDEIQAAGTFDRLVEWDGRRFVADVKTGSIEWGIGKIAIQLAGYSRSSLYDDATGERSPLDVDQSNALIIHLPAGEAKCDLVWVNIAEGWRGVQLASEVLAWRKNKSLTARWTA